MWGIDAAGVGAREIAEVGTRVRGLVLLLELELEEEEEDEGRPFALFSMAFPPTELAEALMIVER